MGKKTFGKPFFSIIIPTLNEEKYIGRLLNDISKQKKAPLFEVIVIDACSEDQTKEKVFEFKNQIKLEFLLSKKRNLAYQRNLGAKHASGKYLIFCDADISLPQNFLAKAYKVILSRNNLIVVPLGDEKKGSVVNSGLTTLSNNMITLSQYLSRPFTYGACLIFERNFFHHMNGFTVKSRQDKKKLFPEDVDFMMRAKKAGVLGLYTNKLVFTLSYRRFEKEGWIKVITKYAAGASEMILRGKVDIFSIPYEMGGHVYAKDIKKDQKNIALNLLKKIEKIGKQLNDLLGIK